MDVFFLALGIVGSLCCLSMYFLLEQGRIGADSPLFYLINGVGGVLVVISVAADFDKGDVGAILQDTVWATISLMGLVKTLRARAKREGA